MGDRAEITESVLRIDGESVALPRGVRCWLSTAENAIDFECRVPGEVAPGRPKMYGLSVAVGDGTAGRLRRVVRLLARKHAGGV